VSDEEINNVTNLSDFRDGNFGKNYGVEMTTGALQGLHSRAVVVLDENGKVIHSQQVPDIGEEPDYLSALKPLL
jgi:thiol peroxidase